MHPLPAHLRRLTGSSYLALGAGVFILAVAVQLGLYLWLLRPALARAPARDPVRALVRWLALDLVWQVAVLAGAWAYVQSNSGSHPAGVAWIVPALAAILGTALPLQLVAATALRAARR